MVEFTASGILGLKNTVIGILKTLYVTCPIIPPTTVKTASPLPSVVADSVFILDPLRSELSMLNGTSGT